MPQADHTITTTVSAGRSASRRTALGMGASLGAVLFTSGKAGGKGARPKASLAPAELEAEALYIQGCNELVRAFYDLDELLSTHDGTREAEERISIGERDDVYPRIFSAEDQLFAAGGPRTLTGARAAARAALITVIRTTGHAIDREGFDVEGHIAWDTMIWLAGCSEPGRGVYRELLDLSLADPGLAGERA